MRLLHAARLSRKARGHEQTGIETSDHEARRWAEQGGHVIVATVADTKSGTTNIWARPNLKPWVTDPNRLAQYDGIVAYKSDRLSREAWADEIQIRLWAQQHGKQLFIVSPSLHWPPANQAEQLSWEIFASQAHEEWKNTSERYQRMQGHLRGNGFLVGDAPFGFRIVCAEKCGQDSQDCKHHKTLEPDPALRPYVLEMVRRYLDGDSLATICHWLDSEGIKPRTAAKWYPTGLRHILANPALIGVRKHKGMSTVLKFEPILDRATWAKLQAKLDGNPRHGAISDEPTLLTGIIFCGLCGRIMHRKAVYTARKDGSKRYLLYYRCDGTPKDRSTCKNMIRMDLADSIVSDWVVQVLGRAELIERIVTSGNGREDEIQDVRDSIRDLDPEAGDYDARLSGLRAELSRLRNLPAEPAKPAERPTGLSIKKYWASLGEDTAAKRRFLLAGKVKALAVSAVKGRELDFSVECLVGGDWTWR